MRRRTGWIAAGSAVALLAAGVIAWRVLAPTEVVTAAVTGYPSAAPVPGSGARGALINSPLIVDSRLRVYAGGRQIWADDQPDYRWETSPYWSYRRWPQTVTAVVSPSTPAPIVAGLWSDGQLIGLDAQTGKVLWRADTGITPEKVDGRRTGSSLVWEQRQLRTGQARDGRAVVLVVGEREVAAFAATDGAPLWRAPITCAAGDVTVPGHHVFADGCAGELVSTDLSTGTQTRVPATGKLNGLGCRVFDSECLGIRVGTTATLLDRATPTRAPALDRPGTWLATTTTGGPVAVDSTFTARDPVTGAKKWTWQPGKVSDTTPATIIGTAQGRVFLLTQARTLIALDTETGTELSRSSLELPQDRGGEYAVGPVYTAGEYVVIERHTPGVPVNAGDDEYYFTNRPVLLAVS